MYLTKENDTVADIFSYICVFFDPYKYYTPLELNNITPPSYKYITNLLDQYNIKLYSNEINAAVTNSVKSHYIGDPGRFKTNVPSNNDDLKKYKLLHKSLQTFNTDYKDNSYYKNFGRSSTDNDQLTKWNGSKKHFSDNINILYSLVSTRSYSYTLLQRFTPSYANKIDVNKIDVNKIYKQK